MLGSDSSLTRFSWTPIFYIFNMEQLPIWPPQSTYWVIQFPSIVVRLSGFWLPCTRNDSQRFLTVVVGYVKPLVAVIHIYVWQLTMPGPTSYWEPSRLRHRRFSVSRWSRGILGLNPEGSQYVRWPCAAAIIKPQASVML